MGLLCSFSLALGGMLGSQFVVSLMQGFSLSYVLVGFVRLICLLSFPDSEDPNTYFKSTIMYFTLNIVILSVMMASIPVIYSNPN